MPAMNITEAWLSRVAANEVKGQKAKLSDDAIRQRYWDTTLPGFGVIVGRRFATFVVQTRVHGKQRLFKIGRHGRPGAGDDHAEIWTVTRARKEAMRLLGAAQSGVDLVTERAAERATSSEGPTLRDAFAAHLAKLRKKGRSEATAATLEKSMAYVEAWLDRPITELTGQALVALHDQIKQQAKPRANARNDKGAPLANRVVTNIGTVWQTLNKQLAGALGNWNPAKSVDKDKLKPKRTRVDDLPAWLASVERMRNPIQRDGLLFALFTGLRSEDVRTVRFENVDEVARTLRLPDPKGGEERAFTIPLPKTCLEIIERRRAGNRHQLAGVDDGGWTFPTIDSAGNVGPIGDLRQQVHYEATGKHSRLPIEDVHTLRRTYLSVASEAGIGELDQRVLSNHAFGSQDVHESYISQHIDHLAACQDRIEAALWQRLKPTPKRSRGKLHVV